MREGLGTIEDEITGGEITGSIELMAQIENYRAFVQDLLRVDRKRRNLTSALVTCYIVVAILSTVLAIVHFATLMPATKASLADLKIPLLGIPWPVLIWSLIGSFAAMIYRFNANPIHDFGDAIKWMITRPIQGLVLGSAMYIVLMSGTFVLAGGNVGAGSAAAVADDVILVLCFLVGFSDRFADGVFTALAQTYARSPGLPDSGRPAATASGAAGHAVAPVASGVRSDPAPPAGSDDQSARRRLVVRRRG